MVHHRVAVASGSRLAAEGGAAVADLGGNAVDAAIAAAIVTMCTDPGVVSPAASGFVAVQPAGGDAYIVDGYAEMPGRQASPDRFGNGDRVTMAYGGSLTTMAGYGSVATPGAFAGLEMAWCRHGRLPWAVLFEPAIAAVEAGFPLTSAAAEYLTYAHDVLFGLDPAGHALLHDAVGEPLRQRDLVRVPDLADSLRLIATEGAAALYLGDLGALVADAVDAGGGLLSRADLAAYSAVVRSPVSFSLGLWNVSTNPPPAVGGVTMAAIALLAATIPGPAWSPAFTTALAGVQRTVLDYRRSSLTDIDGVAAAAAELLDAAGSSDLARLVTSPSTSHTSAADREGNAAAITVSAGYGAGVIPPGTGIWLNNSLGELELHPAGYHGLAPGTRLISNMAPTVASGSGGVIAVGSPGADRITTAVSSFLLNLTQLDMSLEDAITHPRMHSELFDGVATIAYEPGLDVMPPDGMALRPFPGRSMYFGGVQAAMLSPDGLLAAADPRREGGVAYGGAM